eukprot:5643499-Amphidinium_carterae.1
MTSPKLGGIEHIEHIEHGRSHVQHFVQARSNILNRRAWDRLKRGGVQDPGGINILNMAAVMFNILSKLD